VDHKFSPYLSGGFEVSKRDLTVPRQGTPPITDWEEENYRTYLYWTPHSFVSLGLEYDHEDFERFEPLGTGRPPNTETHLAPATFSFFHPSGFFARLTGTYVNQEVELTAGVFADDHDEFVIVDAMMGYRLPRRYGTLTIEFKNLFDTQFNFQGSDFRTSQRVVHPLFQPEQTFFTQLTLAF